MTLQERLDGEHEGLSVSPTGEAHQIAHGPDCAGWIVDRFDTVWRDRKPVKVARYRRCNSPDHGFERKVARAAKGPSQERTGRRDMTGEPID